MRIIFNSLMCEPCVVLGKPCLKKQVEKTLNLILWSIAALNRSSFVDQDSADSVLTLTVEKSSDDNRCQKSSTTNGLRIRLNFRCASGPIGRAGFGNETIVEPETV